MKKYRAGDFLLLGEIIIIGLAAAAHLTALMLGWTFSRCAQFFWGLAGGAFAWGVVFSLYRMRRGKRVPEKGCYFPKDTDRTVRCMYGLLAVLFLTQLIFICSSGSGWRRGDMTVETVGSFLAADGLYQVNPMTGLPYTEGLPARLKILCLPTLYGSLCKLTKLSPSILVRKAVPIVMLLSSYTAFAMLACALFPKETEKVQEKRLCFLIVVSLLLWAGAYQYGMDGFSLLCCGWMGVTIRNLVLLPWMISLCIRGKWGEAALCIPAEACITWTLYGCGVCLVFWLGMAVAGSVLNGKRGGGERKAGGRRRKGPGNP